ncbi:hypothetical protein DSCO28_19430 [Desulfosarcina ovata subsp. sediminis]|uniref:Uncharacterized protein n=1 Tax=Desulfosarcina ovata subsp. sediminis TaxID=885957 RepID=A0A5K7ZMJ8_9BACT|nr:hypothetical protein [Desulfosarcina ovata]BBO81377.1 hypothetical protein DSCO28_19430 [Desulfosarcina ovata subsp. sediminis]
MGKGAVEIFRFRLDCIPGDLSFVQFAGVMHQGVVSVLADVVDNRFDAFNKMRNVRFGAGKQLPAIGGRQPGIIIKSDWFTHILPLSQTTVCWSALMLSLQPGSSAW